MAGSVKLSAPIGPFKGTIDLPISKSIANRMLVLGALSGQPLKLDQANLPDDVRLMVNALSSSQELINLQNAGTAMRFLTAYFSIQKEREVVLTGNAAMQQRPIGNLVDALRTLGADISYEAKEGFPPITIAGKRLRGGTVDVESTTSSQFISALMLIAPFLENGIDIRFQEKPVSTSYIKMTAELLEESGGRVQSEGSKIQVSQSSILNPQSSIESDWSAASYFYGMAALRPGSKLLLKGLKLDSAQGDCRIAEIMAAFGVNSKQIADGVEITSNGSIPTGKFSYDLNSEPDIVQTLACFHAAKGDEVTYSGIEHLRFKETDRLAAIQAELKKFNVQFSQTENGWKQRGKANWNGKPVSTYGDHRMAMAFSILATRCQGLEIEEPSVVSKSFPGFWKTTKTLGFTSEP